MLFNSLEFLAFLPIVLIGYYALGWRSQNVWLLAASYIFYGMWDVRFLSLILISTCVDFYVGQGIAGSRSQRTRGLLLATSVAVNLGILGFFKYFNFFVDSFSALLGQFGLSPATPVLEIVLPVGISFYTFQTMSYTIDIYRDKCRPTRDFLSFALFVAYFPQLVAGPIERAKRLLPKIMAPRSVSWPGIAVGVELILIGYLKKVGVADVLAPYVEVRFANPEFASASELVLTAYLFSLQIYCDFSGYTDIARGVSKLFGIDLMRNFEQPYLSRNITEFWRRWHISLSTWLRDYLYIPLGGNRKGQVRTYINLMITMLLGGLWHGANWTFVVWGAMHGAYLSIHKLFSGWVGRVRVKQQEQASPWDPIWIFITFNLVTLTWVFFRAEDFSHAYQFLHGILTFQENMGAFNELSWFSPRILLLATCVILIDLIQNRTKHHANAINLHWVPRGIVYAVLMAITLVLGNLDEQAAFIYFQF